VNKLKLLKITLLIVILAEEIRSVSKKELRGFTQQISIDASGLIEDLQELKSY